MELGTFSSVLPLLSTLEIDEKDKLWSLVSFSKLGQIPDEPSLIYLHYKLMSLSNYTFTFDDVMATVRNDNSDLVIGKCCITASTGTHGIIFKRMKENISSQLEISTLNNHHISIQLLKNEDDYMMLFSYGLHHSAYTIKRRKFILANRKMLEKIQKFFRITEPTTIYFKFKNDYLLKMLTQ